ncbi:SusC/RagA family TonB-linked outer membrane protein [Sediminitomix flava]|uniref:TonB-linked SusC/RagA family outer membrane protein n=1 Tax=Sediminitomix flava TaxID=379075 RepID=A0A315ZA22_SEDFL|nr:TonB-dependent receptor [Sediminitomix flava]PWJ41913.1 TonB-linked SusC/RagA family outer membrane protein [Sediminitomix flava]
MKLIQRTMSCRWLLFGLLSFAFVLPSQAQEVIIKGNVISATDKMPLPGVNVKLEGTSTGTVTDFDGNYTLSVGENSTLVFSYIGFQTTQVEVAGRSVINIELIEEADQLDEIVVIGYGEISAREVSTAVTKIDGSKLAQQPVARAEQALQGNAPGVVVLQESGSPGAPMTIRIRGNSSVNNSNPLYIVDGVQVPNLDFLNSSDIENISILKDGASAAIYGARGGNGVVLVTTKTGDNKTTAPKVSFSGYYGVQSLGNKPELMDKNQYIDFFNNSVDYYNTYGLEEGIPSRGKFTAEEAAKLPDTDWYDEVFNQAAIQNYHASVGGGGESYNYMFATGIYKQDGMVGGDLDKSNFERKSLRGSFNKNLAEGLKINFGGTYAQTDRNFLAENSAGTGSAILNYVNNLPPIFPVYADNGEIFNPGRQTPVQSYNGVELPYIGAITNPMLALELTNNNAVIDVVSAFAGASYEVNNFKFRTNYSYYGQTGKTRSFTPTFDYPEQTFTNLNAYYQEGLETFFRTQWDNTLQYTFEQNDHKLVGLLGMTVIEDSWSSSSMNGQNFYTNNFDDVTFAMMKDKSQINVTPASVVENGWLSYFGRVNYSYKGKYLFEATVRSDASSKFGPNNRWGYFPSVSAGWNISDEEFIKDIDFIDLLKFRASWGVNGNDQIDAYQYLPSLTSNAQYVISGQQTDGIAPIIMGNQDIKWEEVTQTNIGLDADFLNNRIGISVDYFIKETSDMLAQVGTPIYVGIGAPFSNVGSVRNSGIEIALSHRNTVAGDLKYNLGFNFATMKNEVTDLGGGQPINSGVVQPSWASPISKTEEGHSIASFYGYQVDGFDEAGNIVFKDLDGEEGITEADKTFIGNPFPEFTYGITGGLEYKGFDLNFFFFGSQGNDIYKAFLRPDAINLNRPTYFGDSWSADNSNSDVARSNLFGYHGGHDEVSDYYIEDGSFLRLKNISLGYSLPTQLVEKIGASKVRVYVSAQNLFTITDYTGADPEIGQSNSGAFLDVGIDRGFYPQPRTVMGGFQINF